ncbi:two-component system sensor histidine kinase CreC [uncultured Desulfobacter sp.]|uniref:two-component system sensor histidine kinase CreC n=1 Tax=uncultured Desulfobacter sp. TaxID=240139 RepID=UPI0029F4EA2A|nr:two-component system sensor histidine kinase CreC [uncultured Desulfobacter sp.]
MRLRTRLLISFCLFFIPAVYYLTAEFQNNLKYRYLEGVEESLVDQARILAGMVGARMEAHEYSSAELTRIFNGVYRQSFNAMVYDLSKTGVDTRVYITDQQGLLIFDSLERDPPGTDYSRWRDVFLTLHGEYGARSTRDDPGRPDLTTLYVAAPVMIGTHMAGVLVVGKPTENINDFIENAKAAVFKRSIGAALLSLVLAVLALFFITRPLDRLNRYVKSISKGEDEQRPSLGRSDIAEMGKAFEKIRADLAAKEYIESYVQSLTHEIKSPVAAIAGAAELLQEDNVPKAQQQRFLDNISAEANRIQTLVERMLGLSALEHRDSLEKPAHINLCDLVNETLQRFEQDIKKREIRISTDFEGGCDFMGDAFLISQAVINLLQNAIEFSPLGGRVHIALKVEGKFVQIAVMDQGPGIPDFAADKIFNRFFSTQRPDTHKKSTGLGLNFVMEIAQLHGGTVTVKNRSRATGTRAVLSLQR